MAVTGNLGKYIIMDAVADSVNQVLKIKAIHWYGTGTAGDLLVLKDQNGDVIFSSIAPSISYDRWYRYEAPVNGVVVDTLGSGKVDLLIG